MMKTREDFRKFTLELSLDAYTLALAHFHVNNRWSKIGTAMGVFSTVASVLSGASIITDVQGYDLVTAVLAVSASVTIALATFLNPTRQATEHHSTATNYLRLYHDTQYFYQVESQMEGADPDDLLEKLSALKDSYNEQDQRSPRVGVNTYDRGRREARIHFLGRGQVVGVDPEKVCPS